MRKREEEKDLIPSRLSGHVIWGTQSNDLYDLKRKNISGEVLTMFCELTMCQSVASSL